MAGLGRKGQSAAIWPGFLDLMTSLVMVLMFVLTVFMIVQFALRDTINNKESELADLNSQLAGLAKSLGMEREKSAGLEAEVGRLTAGLAEKGAALDAAGARIAGFEAQVAGLIAEAAKRSAELQATQADRDKAAADAAALTLSLEAARKKAEDTLTLLAAAEAARKELDAEKAASLTEADRQRALLAAADQALSQEKSVSAEGARRLALLNEQVAALRQQLQSLQGLLDASAARDAASKVQIEALGSQLNSALAQAASEQKRRADLEEAERKRLAAEAASLQDKAAELARYRSEFFGKLSEVLAGRPGVRVVGDRFVFSSEVLFQPASADLSPEGKAQIAGVVRTLQEVAAAIPPDLPWIIRVDGHTDDVPLNPGGRFADNWELSQARALSVVRYMQDDLGFPPERLAAAGFGQYQPVAPGDTPEARAQNRRIELKLTDR